MSWSVYDEEPCGADFSPEGGTAKETLRGVLRTLWHERVCLLREYTLALFANARRGIQTDRIFGSENGAIDISSALALNHGWIIGVFVASFPGKGNPERLSNMFQFWTDAFAQFVKEVATNPQVFTVDIPINLKVFTENVMGTNPTVDVRRLKGPNLPIEMRLVYHRIIDFYVNTEKLIEEIISLMTPSSVVVSKQVENERDRKKRKISISFLTLLYELVAQTVLYSFDEYRMSVQWAVGASNQSAVAADALTDLMIDIATSGVPTPDPNDPRLRELNGKVKAELNKRQAFGNPDPKRLVQPLPVKRPTPSAEEIGGEGEKTI